jgi:hypothetical protein
VRNPADIDGWSAASTLCNLRYFNTCTGWMWAWSGFASGARIGVVCPGVCDPLGRLVETRTLIATGAPAGYGYTGTVAIHAVSGHDCPTGAALQSQPWLPTGSFSYQVHFWNAPEPRVFALVYSFGPDGGGSACILTDHPAAGPAGPAACGTCYPTTRVNRTFYWGTANTPLCPGSTFFDGVCDAQLCVIEYFSGIGVEVEPQSWGAIKSLYR